MKTKRRNINSSAFFVGVEGNKIVSFGSGQPDLPPPPQIYKTLSTFRSFKYGLIQGQENLRKALSKEYPRSHKNDFVITNGASEALDLTFRALFMRYGKCKIVIPRPYYYSYPFLISLASLIPVYSDLNAEGRMDIKDLRRKLPFCKAILINSPSNPTGKIETIETLKEIEKLCKKFGVYIISDEVYKDLIYERENYLIKGENVLTINSFSKTFAMCGFRVGYLYARDRKLVEQVIDIKGKSSMNTSIISQEMAYEATKVPREMLRGQIEIWRERRDFIYSKLKKLGFDLWKPEGAFYVFPKIKNANKVVNDLFYDYKVIVYDGAWFGSPDRIRLSYALDKEKIEEGLKRIGQYLKKHPGLV